MRGVRRRDWPSSPADCPVCRRTENLGATQWGMISFLASEVAFFATLIVAYVTFLGKDSSGPDSRRKHFPCPWSCARPSSSCRAA